MCLETVLNHDFGGTSGKISLETVTFGTKTSIWQELRQECLKSTKKCKKFHLVIGLKCYQTPYSVDIIFIIIWDVSGKVIPLLLCTQGITFPETSFVIIKMIPTSKS